MLFASLSGQLGKHKLSGIHLERGDMIRIAGDHSRVILDGELLQADEGRPIVLTSSAPVPFLRLAAWSRRLPASVSPGIPTPFNTSRRGACILQRKTRLSPGRENDTGG